MNIDEAMPSNSSYIKAVDLQGKPVLVTIERIEMESMDDGDKPVVYFRGKSKGLPLNQTNKNNIKHLYGVMTEGWIGKQIVLFESTADFKGETHQVVRVRGPVKPSMPPPPKPAPQSGDIMDDEIPF